MASFVPSLGLRTGSRRNTLSSPRRCWAASGRRTRLVPRAVSASEDSFDWGDSSLPRQEWIFRGHKTVYRSFGTDNADAPSLVCVHGFGAHSMHWRKNLPELGKHYRVYAIDLLGFGFSAKPAVGAIDSEGNETQYNYDYWSSQVAKFIEEVVQDTTFLIANSIGCVACLQAAVDYPQLVNGVVQFDPSLRLLNVRRRSWLDSITAPLIMKALVNLRPLAQYFFSTLASPGTLRSTLNVVYHDKSKVDDALVYALRAPAMEPGALDVFLAFITYDTGPIPEDYIPILECPTTIVWGENDQLEPIKIGRTLGEFDTVEDFIVLPNVGHCPQDEVPEQANEIIRSFVTRHHSPGRNAATLPSNDRSEISE